MNYLLNVACIINSYQYVKVPNIRTTEYIYGSTYSLHVAPNYTDLFLAVQFLEIVKENLM